MRFRIFLIFILAFLDFQLSATAQTPSAFEFFKPSKHMDLVLSPNGRYVAFTQTKTDKVCLDKYGRVAEKQGKCKDKSKVFRTSSVINVYDLENSEFVNVSPLPENHYISWLRFASDDRLLSAIYVPTTIGRKGWSYSLGGSRVYSMPVNPESSGSEKTTVLFKDEKSMLQSNRRLSSVSNFLKDDPEHIIMPARKGGDLDLWKVNVYSGDATRVATGTDGTFYWYTNRKGEPVFRYDCSSRCRKVRVYVPADEPGEWTKIREFKTKPDDELEDYQFYPVALTDNEDQIYVISDEDGDERRSVKIFDLKSKSYVKTVYEHPTMDVSGVVRSNKTGDYMGVYLYEDRLTYALTDSRLQKHIDALNKYFDNEYNVRLIGYNSDGTKAITYVWGHNYPGSYYIYDFNTRSIDKLMSTEPELEKKLSSDGRVMNVRMRDGQNITVYHYYPKGQQAGAPLIVMPHGGPHVRDRFTFDLWAQFYVSRGYQVVTMNFRGSSGYGRSFEEAGHGEWGGLMQDDITDTVKHFHSTGQATPDKTCIVGYSYGGYAALYGAATTPELYKCVISGAGPSDLNRMMKDDKGNLNEESYETLKESVGDPKTEKEKLEALSPVNMAAQITAPVLLIHPEFDSRVEITHSQKMEKALRKAGKSVEFWEMEGEGHSGWDLENDILYLNTVESFLAKHLRP